MAGIADVNLDDLENFISALKRFNRDMEDGWKRLNARWQRSSDTWRDKKKEQFTEQVGWNDVVKQMQGYVDTSDLYLRHLQSLARKVEDYLNS